jgi:hypothetical protein
VQYMPLRHFEIDSKALEQANVAGRVIPSSTKNTSDMFTSRLALRLPWREFCLKKPE